MDLAAFRATLRRHRDARRWSQEKLAAQSEMDHSLVSRLEGGQRTPTREAIRKLATGLGLTGGQCDDLLVLCGYLPDSPRALIAHVAPAVELYDLLGDGTLPPHVAEQLTQAVRAAMALARYRIGVHP